MNKFNIKALALSLGLLWAFAMVMLSLFAMQGMGNEFASLLSNAYVGYDLTPIGIVIGAVWGFFDAAIGGLVFGWLYNYFAAKFK